MRQVVIALLLMATPLAAGPRPIGGAQAQVFDAKAKAFKAQQAVVAYQEKPEVLQVQVPGFQPGAPLNARLKVDQLPHYQAWIQQRQAEGGMAWKALAALLDELQGRPVAFLTLGPLPAQGPAEVRVGLLEGRRFELYGRVRGTVASSRRGLVFEVQDMALEKTSAKAAWALLAPLARAQASRMAGQSRGAGL
jgi:hypothetical protein